MISPPTILVQCDQMVPVDRPKGVEQCRRSAAMTLPMSLDGSMRQVRNLFLAAHRGWWITAEDRVYCPQCATIALAKVRAEQQAAEVGGA